MNIIVTGSQGFIGKKLCVSLSARGHNVFAVTRTIPAPIPGIHWLKWDMSHEEIPNDFPKNADAIIHLAQSSQFRHFPDGACDMMQVNVQATLALLEYARKQKIPKFIFTSTGGIYGTHPKNPFNEQDFLAPNDKLGFYVTSKYISELLINNYTSFLTPTILRIFFAYGKDQQSDRLIPRLITNVKNNVPITLEGESGLIINPIYVDDVLTVIHSALHNNEPSLLNVGGKEILSLKEIGQHIGVLLKKEPIFTQTFQSEPKMLVGDIQKLQSEFNFSPSISFKEGLERMLLSENP